MSWLFVQFDLGNSTSHYNWSKREELNKKKSYSRLYADSVFFIFHIVLQQTLAGQVHLKGTAGERQLKFSLTVSSNHSDNTETALPVHRLAAKAEIKRLQDLEKGKQ